MTSATTRGEVRAPELARPLWRRWRVLLAVAAVVVLGAIVVGTVVQQPSAPLDPTSTQSNGSKALVRVLGRFGVDVRTTSSLDDALRRSARASIVVTAPDEYSDAQLHRLAGAGRVVLVRPGTRASHAAVAGLEPDPTASVDGEADCADPGAEAAGYVQLPDDAQSYTIESGERCFGGALVITDRVVVLGSSQVLQNGSLAQSGVAALAVNALSDNRQVQDVVWLRPGADASGSGSASVWDLFPDGVERVFWFVVALGVLVVLWRVRRLGGVVAEPLPVIVRAAEVVEGHGRLYARADARDRAAAALRSAAVTRLARRLALPAGTDAHGVGLAVAARVQRAPAEVVDLLAGPVPADNAALVRLAGELDRLEATVGRET